MSEPAVGVRCAIYTRKSSDEGLEQAFNSLHAQRESCEAYIRSQAGQGWSLSPGRYDDGAFSGARMDRPALRRLLDDVQAGRIEAVVVYKVDRLTRSLADFARIIELLEKHRASFVSVTQAFNTTSSMGRLTLNVLLSFAQFEREVTSERIRDKIAASKAKGMWMGGTLPLGYDAPLDNSRALVVNETEAQKVRAIFSWYLDQGSLSSLQRKLDAEGIRSKSRVYADGRTTNGFRFSRGALRHLLANRLYLGEIGHKGVSHQGRHAAIVVRATFEAVQAVLAANSERRRNHIGVASRMLLSGRVFDADGLPMAPKIQYAAKKRYAYYASQPLPRGGVDWEADDAIRRAPAHAVEGLVKGCLCRLTGGELAPAEVRTLVRRVEIHPTAVEIVIVATALPREAGSRSATEIVRGRLSPGEQVLPDPGNTGLLRIILPTRLVMRGGRTWFAGSDGRPINLPQHSDFLLLRNLRTSHEVLRWCGIDQSTITPQQGMRSPRSTRDRRVVQLAFLAPDLQRAILTGKVRSLPTNQIPISWAKQRRLFASAERRRALWL